MLSKETPSDPPSSLGDLGGKGSTLGEAESDELLDLCSGDFNSQFPQSGSGKGKPPVKGQFKLTSFFTKKVAKIDEKVKKVLYY